MSFKTKTIVLPVHDITVSITGDGSGTITSSLPKQSDAPDDAPLAAAMNTIESLVLAHACAGVDLRNPRYLEGLETAIDKAFDEYYV